MRLKSLLSGVLALSFVALLFLPGCGDKPASGPGAPTTPSAEISPGGGPPPKK